jgi:hypothetical protein
LEIAFGPLRVADGEDEWQRAALTAGKLRLPTARVGRTHIGDCEHDDSAVTKQGPSNGATTELREHERYATPYRIQAAAETAAYREAAGMWGCSIRVIPFTGPARRPGRRSLHYPANYRDPTV